MSISVADNFKYQGNKPLDERIKYSTVADMKAVSTANLYDGCLAYVTATKKNYQYDSSNTVDETLGKWRELSTGGGGASSLNDLSDVDLTSVSKGDILRYNSNSQQWENQEITSAYTPVYTEVLTAGSTTITFSNLMLYEDSRIRIFSNPFIYGLITNVTQTSNSIILTCNAQASNVNIMIEVATSSRYSPPNGSTVVPTDDVQLLLNCAGIFNKDYTTLNQLLADTTSLQTILSNSNAADYLARSTTFASSFVANEDAMTYIGANNYCSDVLLAVSIWRDAICNSQYFESVLNVKIPTLTSDNNNPSGIVTSASDYIDSNCKAFWACDDDDSSNWHSASGTSHWWQIYFPTAIKVNIYSYIGQRDDLNARNLNGKIQGSNDGSTWTDIVSANCTSRRIDNVVFENNNKYHYYRLLSNGQYFVQQTIQLYGRS